MKVILLDALLNTLTSLLGILQDNYSAITSISNMVLSAAVVYQIWLMRKDIKTRTYLELIDDVFTIDKIFIDIPSLSKIWRNEFKENQDEDHIRARWLATIILNFYENVYYSYKNGIIPKSLWKSWEKHIINAICTLRPLREHWCRVRWEYWEEFIKFVESKCNTICKDNEES